MLSTYSIRFLLVFLMVLLHYIKFFWNILFSYLFIYLYRLIKMVKCFRLLIRYVRQHRPLKNYWGQKTNIKNKKLKKKKMEMRGIDPRTSRMLSERSTIWATSPSCPTSWDIHSSIKHSVNVYCLLFLVECR